MKKYITNTINFFLRTDKKVLGRWNIDYCDKKTNRKIDLSNEDHCGPCGDYMAKDLNLENEKRSKNRK